MSDARIAFRTNLRFLPNNVKLKFGSGNGAQIVWSTGDADNHSLVLALGDSNQALHVTDVGAIATDWNVSADAHPTLYVHSNTTPATDYISIGGHDGTNATIDLVGGTTLKIAFDGSAEIDISATALSPSSDGGNALGTAALGWNGLHLNTGTAISWENGDITLTHADGKLTLGGDGAVEFDFANHEMTNVDINSGAIDGTVIGAAAVAAGSFAALVGTTGTYSGVIKTTEATPATSGSTGSGQFGGGIGVAGDSFFATQDVAIKDSVAGDGVKLLIQNTNDASGSRAELQLLAAASANAGVDPVVLLNIAGGSDWTVGVDNSDSDRFMIGPAPPGVNDALRITTGTPPVITFNTTQGSDFDYVCDACGRHEACEFTCCGKVEWHDDATDYRGLMLREPAALDYFERVGLIQRGVNDVTGEPEEFMALQMIGFVGSFANQNRQRMDAQFAELDRRLEKIGV